MDALNLIQDNMLDYAGAVNQLRAIPDARTGLKPIHRKILYEMYTDKIRSSGKYKKCAYMVGQIIARFSEHGDSATYDALVRLAQPWIQRYPLLDFHGNYGSQFGDPQAAMRYTESKLSKLSEEGFLSGLNKNNVDWMPNFTAEEEEPTTLPAIFPGLFCLPSQGIGYATACNFLTYNLNEVAQGIIDYLEGKDFPILQYDLASGGVIINPQIMETIYKTGKGSVIVDCKYKIIDNKIIITELPFNVMFDNVLEDIVKYCKENEDCGIEDVYNSSGKNNLEMTIITNKDPEQVMNLLLETTKLRNSYGINQVALVDNMPKLLTTKEMAEIYIKHNLSCIKRETEFDIKKLQERIEILEGLSKALEDIDNVINIIKQSNSAADAKINLIKKYSLTELQVNAILNMKLSRLANMERIEVENELKDKKEKALILQKILDSEQEQINILKERLRNLAEKFGDKRRTEVIQKDIVTSKTKKEKEKIVEDVVITFNSKGYIKSIPTKLYRGSDDIFSFKARTDEMILLFSSLGKLYRLKVENIKQCSTKDKGTAIGAILNLEQNEQILYVTSMNIEEKSPFITFVSKSGKIKKSDKTIYFGSIQNLKGMKCAGLVDNDYFVKIAETNGDYITIISTDNMALQFRLDTINVTGKTSSGVIAMKFNDGQKVKEVQINKQENNKIPVRNRAGKGVKIE